MEVTFDKKGYLSAQVVPAFSDGWPEAPVQPYLAQGAEAAAILQHLRRISAGFGQPLPALGTDDPGGQADAGSPPPP